MPRCLARLVLFALDEGVRVVVVHGTPMLWRARAWLEATAR